MGFVPLPPALFTLWIRNLLLKKSRQRTFISRTALLARNPGGICSLTARAFLFMDQKPAFGKKVGKELSFRAPRFWRETLVGFAPLPPALFSLWIRNLLLERKQAKNFYVAGRSFPRFVWRKPQARRPRFPDLSIRILSIYLQPTSQRPSRPWGTQEAGLLTPSTDSTPLSFRPPTGGPGRRNPGPPG